MSTTRSRSALDLVAEAVVAEACASSGHRRLFLGRYLGLEPGELHDALLERAGHTLDLVDDVPPLAAIEADGALLIPYLVVAASDSGGNRGSQGFAARLRSEFTRGADGERRVLLVLDPDPVETVRSAAEDAASLPRMRWGSLCRAATVLAADGPAAELAAAVADDLGDRRGNVALLERFVAFCAERWEDATAAGDHLQELELYLRDPMAATSAKTRLKRGARWRRDLDKWSAPGEDLEGRLARKLEPEAVAQILAAVEPFGINYGSFTLADLEEREEREPPRLRRPLSIGGAQSAVSSGNAVAIWLGADGGTIKVGVGGNLDGSETVELRWGDGDFVSTEVEGGAAELEVRHDGWRFGTLALARGDSVADSALVACYCADGSWFPFERAFLIDVSTAAFRAEDEPFALAAARGGGVLGPVPLEIPDTGRELPDEPVEAIASRQGESHPLPLLLVGEDVGGGRGGDEEDERDEDDERGGDEREEQAAQPSPVHAYLDAVKQRGEATELDITFRVAEDEATITVGGEIYPFASQQIGPFNGLALERELLKRPQVWSYTATATPDGPSVRDDPLLDRLSLAGIDANAVRAFEQARERFFAAASAEGSVYALATGAGFGEALDYVSAYRGLLDAVPRRDRYAPEFDRCLLVDAVVDTASGDRFIAPTNPVTVAFYLGFAEIARHWSREWPGQLLDDDLDAIVPDFLLPVFAAGGTPYEAILGGPFLWRQFETVRERGRAPADEGRLIAERLSFFLTVHSTYSDAEQTLAVSALDSGDGSAIVDALRRFYAIDYAREEYRRPKLDVYLLSDEGRVPAAVEDLLAGGEDEHKLDPLIRTRVRISGCSYAQGLPFSHLTFVFRTPTRRQPDPFDMRRRGSSLYVGGFAAAPGRAVEEGPNERSFSWGTFAANVCGSVPAGPAGDELPHLVKGTLELVGAQPRELLQPYVTRMATTVVPREFMPEEYRQSVWVVHLDHVLGLEAFAPDHAAPGRYLIDYDDVPGAAGLGGVTATARVEPYRNALTHALKDLERLEPQGLERILNLLNSVSGRWALRILRDNPERIRERIGTVAAIAVLQEYDLSFQRTDGAGVLLPLDEIFTRLPELGIPRPESRATDDLLYVFVRFGAEPPVLRARLLEVKYRSRGGPELAAARQQIENTEGWLDKVFMSEGPGYLFRARDLAETLRASSSRGSAFGLAGELDRQQFERALERVASGEYELDFGYWVGGERLAGDVVSVELESDSAAVRSSLPGAGRPAALVRLGRRILTALASGQPLPVPDDWARPEFEPPTAGATAASAGPLPGPGDGGDGAAATSDSGTSGGGGGAPDERERSPEMEDEVRRLARELDAAVLKYELELEPFQPSLAQVGPSVIRFRARPLGRQSLDGVARRAADLGREIGTAEGVLVGQEPYYITVDIPRRERELIRFRDYAHLLGEPEPGALKFLVGMAASGEVTVADLARLPHLLIAGATGSGKSVFLRSLMCSLLEQHGAMDLSILLVDPKQLDFLPFEDLPHLVDGRIIFDPAEAVAALGELIDREIEKRRPLLKRAGASNILEYYEAGGSPQELQQIVIVVDEFADLASTLGRGERAEFMNLIQRYGQMTRAYGIYLVLATQRPSVQVITGDIKANLTARVALKVQASQDSVTILGHGGAESLRDKGDLLFEHGGASERLQGFMVTPSDVAEAVGKWSRP